METDFFTDLVIQRVVCVNNVYTQKNAGTRRVVRERSAIIFKYEGETVYTCGGKTILSNRQNLVVLPAGCSYDWRCTTQGHFYDIEFDSNRTDEHIYRFPVSDGTPFVSLFRRAENAAAAAKTSRALNLLSGVYGILAKLAESTEKAYVSGDIRTKIAPAAEYMHTHLADRLSNRQLAEVCGLSEVYFRKLFTAAYGCSPIRYAANLRISKAKEILDGDYSRISDVARTLGYETICDFSRAFKTACGISPSAYAARRDGKKAE